MTKPSQNQNGHSSPESSSLKSGQFQGIRRRKWGKWVSEIRMPNSSSRIWPGSYDTPEKAARAYDFAVYCLRGSKVTLNFPHSPPKILYASPLSPPQIQAVVAKFSAQEFHLPSENDVASSSSGLEEEQIMAEEGPAFRDSVPLENIESWGSLNVEDIPPLDVSVEDFGIPFQPTEDWGTWDSKII